VPLVDHDEVVQALPPKGADEPLRHRVGPRGAHGRQQLLHPQRREPGAEGTAVDGVSVPEEEAGPAAPGGGLDRLAPHPRRGRVRGDGDVDQLAAAVGDCDEHVEHLERERLDREEVRRPDRAGVVSHERAPGLARWAGWAPPPVPLDRAVADDDAELEQLAADALAAPARVGPRHRGDQLAHLKAQPRPPEPRPGLPAPEEPPPAAVPAEHRLRLHQHEVPPPVPPQPAGHHPEEPVARAQLGALPGRAGEDGELVPQQEVLGHQLAVPA
jgi:hypothetical protein